MRVAEETLLAQLAEFTDELFQISELNRLISSCVDFVVASFNPGFASLAVFDSGDFHLLAKKEYGVEEKTNPTVELTDDVAGAIARGGEVLALMDANSQNYLLIFEDARSPSCELRLPIFIETGCLGVLGLGKKQTGTDYTLPDIDALRVVMNAVAMKCARLLDCEKTRSAGFLIDKPGAPPVVEAKIKIKSMESEDNMLGECPRIQYIKELIDKVSAEDVSILITGESGTGKELIARAIHKKSQRASKPLVAMNCAALADNLVESELFGHEKGAFTGAYSQKKGKFEFANDSTLFLDEIGDMSLQTQAKLLRVLQDGTFQRVGGNKTLHSNARVLAATNKNLFTHIKNGSFREDLFYRINVVQIELPPLRERGQDIILLADHIFHYYNKYYRKNLSGFHDEVYQWLQHYSFPGNIRELRNIVERAVIMEQGEKISLGNLPAHNSERPVVNTKTQASISLEQLEKRHIRTVLEQADNNKSAAARTLGIARKTLREKIQKYNIK